MPTCLTVKHPRRSVIGFPSRTLRILDAITATSCFVAAYYIWQEGSLGFWFWSWFLYGIFGVFMVVSNGTVAVQSFLLRFFRIALITGTLK